MPKYWVKNYFAHGRFPEVGQKQKTEKKEREKERLNNGENNGQATHGARKHAWRTQAAWANYKRLVSMTNLIKHRQDIWMVAKPLVNTFILIFVLNIHLKNDSKTF